MDKLTFVIILVFGIVAMIFPFFRGNKIQQYIQRRGGELVSTESNGFKDSSELLKYYDKHRNLRKVTVYYNTFNTTFDEDEIIEYNTSSPEYRKLEKEEKNTERKNQQYEKQFYKIREGELAIKQEFTNPNKGEFVFLNGKAAPNDKYRLGFMNYIIVENGKIKQFSML